MSAATKKSAKPIQRSPLERFAGQAGGGLQLREITGQTLVNLRGAADDKKFWAAIKKAAGAADELPPAANQSVAIKNGAMFWLGPDEFQIRLFEFNKAAAQTVRQLHSAAEAAAHAAAVEVSDYYTVIQLAGERARDGLAAGCPLDLHPRAFAVGDCAQSRFAKAAVLLWLRDDKPTFELQVRWSYAAYVWNYLRAAAEDN